MRLLKHHPHTSERLGYKGRNNAKKSSYRKHRHHTKATHRKYPPANRQRGGGGDETKTGKLKENASAKETDTKTLPPAAIVAGGETQGERQHEKGKVAQTTIPRGGSAPRLKRIANRNQNNMNHKYH